MNKIPRQVAPWAINDLRKHPQQQELIGDLPENEIEHLADSIQKTGLQNPLHILPDGTIVDGHQRLRAVIKLGWTEVEVVVREDLAQAGEAVTLTFLIESSLHRRQMDPLAIARAFRHLKEIARDLDYEELGYDDRRDIRDQIAERLGGHYSGRSLDRYEQILDMPRVVQDAVISKELPLTLAVKITKLGKARKQAIAERIGAGEPAKEVVQQYVGPRGNSGGNYSQSSPHALYRRLVASLSEGIEGLPQYVEDVAGSIRGSNEVIAVLERSSELIGRLREAEISCRDGAFDAFDDEEDSVF
jgi:hypothetical protein